MTTKNEVKTLKGFFKNLPDDYHRILRYFRRFSSEETLNLVADVTAPVSAPKEFFKIIYGRFPDENELIVLNRLIASSPDADPVSLFHYIINGYDRQTLGTPFTVRFLEKDVAYAMVQDYQLAIDKADIAIGQGVAHGQYEPHLLNFYRERIKPGMVFLDIGANIGLFTMLAAKLVTETGEVTSFEPNSENCRLIMLSMAKNKFENIKLFPMALGNKNGHVLFSTYIGSNGGLISETYSSLLSPNCAVVPMVRLDDMIDKKVDAIKMDVEGAEGLVIEGAKRLIEKYRPLITSEFSMEMLPRVSKISGVEYLNYFKSLQYDINLIDRQTHLLVPISDIDVFIATYGIPTRLEDLAFIPKG